jgi:hypothetical protein
MIFNQPIDAAYKLFKATEKQDRYLPDLDSCKLVSRNAQGDQVDFHVKILMVSVDYRIHHVYDDANYYLHWSLDPSFDNDMREQAGYWRLYQINDKHTLARYGTRIQLSTMIPEFVMTTLTKTNLPSNLSAVKKYIDSGGTYTKPDYKGK